MVLEADSGLGCGVVAGGEQEPVVAGVGGKEAREETEEQRRRREEVEGRLRKMRIERRIKGMVKGTEVKAVHPAVAALLDNPNDLGNYDAESFLRPCTLYVYTDIHNCLYVCTYITVCLYVHT
jgi:hypothetical protein